MRGFFTRLNLIFAAALILVTSGSGVIAQYDDSPATFWNQERDRQQRNTLKQKPTHLIRRAAPRPGFAIEVPLSDSNGLPLNPDDPQAQQNQDKALNGLAARRYSVLVIGDNVAQWLAAGLQEALADRPGINILRKARDASGLVQTAFQDWDKTTSDLLNSSDKIDLGVMMIGSNDKQNLREGNASLDPRTPRWSELYSERIAAIARQFQAKNIPLIWVGMPVMKNDQLSAHLLSLNQMYKEQAEKYGALYIDVWEAFVDDRNLFAFYGPDVNGQMVRLRSNDGIHFTKAGARKLAYFVEKDVRRLYDSVVPIIEAPQIANAPSQKLTSPLEASREMEDQPSLAPVPQLPQRPEAGPVILLTAPALSQGAQLANRRSPGEIETSLNSALTQWRAIDHPGRADDFSWPGPNN